MSHKFVDGPNLDPQLLHWITIRSYFVSGAYARIYICNQCHLKLGLTINFTTAPPIPIMPRLNRFSYYLEGGVFVIEFSEFDVV